MEIARSFRDLNTYKRAREGARRIFAVSKAFPKDERFSLSNQIRRSSRAVGAILAEAWARRRYKGAFLNKLDESLGEAMETQAWLDHALDSEYITAEQFQELDLVWQHVGGMLTNMMNRADDFCKNAPDHPYVREGGVEYDTP
jgi:four helix bundle protein